MRDEVGQQSRRQDEHHARARHLPGGDSGPKTPPRSSLDLFVVLPAVAHPSAGVLFHVRATVYRERREDEGRGGGGGYVGQWEERESDRGMLP